MQIVERLVENVTVLDLKGRLLLDDGHDLFRETLDRVVGLGSRRILLNFDEVTQIDSAGLGVLVSKYISAHKRGGQLKLCNLHVRSFRVLDVTKLLTVFEAFDSVAAGVESFRER